MLAVNFIILALGVLVAFVACFAMFIEEAFAPSAPLVQRMAAKTNAANDSLSARTRRPTARRNRSIAHRWGLNRRVGIRHFST